MSLAAMKQALEALEDVTKEHGYARGTTLFAITVLRAAIKRAQEPVAWMHPSWIDPDTRGWESDSFNAIPIEGWVPLYTAPRQWQGLTEEEIRNATQAMDAEPLAEGWSELVKFARAIEAKLREKNA